MRGHWKWFVWIWLFPAGLFSTLLIPAFSRTLYTNGWHDIALPVKGGGARDGNVAIFGRAYLSTPSMAVELQAR
jgi:hypothetical protein